MKNHNSKDFRLMRSVVLWLYNCKCIVSGCCNVASHVHHDNHYSKDNTITNLVPLCKSCHVLVHKTSHRFKLTNKKIVVQLLKKVVLFSSKV